MNIKYKIVKFDVLLNKYLDNNNNNNFFEKYIKQFHYKNEKRFIIKNKQSYDFYKDHDDKTELEYHILIDDNKDNNKDNKLVAIEKSFILTEKFFDISYFVDIRKRFNIKDNVKIMYNTKLFVDPDYRGKKLCTKLLDEINKYALKNNINYVIAEIHKENIPSIKCHLRNDFIETDILSYKDTFFYVHKIKNKKIKNKKNKILRKVKRNTGNIQKTAFIANFGEMPEKHFKELLEKRDFKIVNEWSPKREKHLIMNKTGKNIKWESIEKECELLNHVPFSMILCQKKTLADLVQKNKHLFNYYPYSFNDDIEKNIKEYQKYKTNNFGNDIWIIKPNMLYGGTGIMLAKTEELTKYRNKQNKYVIQKYLEKPLLLNGYKFDFRMYVIFTPDKKLYIHPHYEVRIAQNKHTLDITTLDSHLTNLTYQEKKGYESTGKRLTHTEFEKEFNKEYGHDIVLFQKVSKILTDTFKTLQKEINKIDNTNYFELYGIDVAMDKYFNPYTIYIRI
jgi:RimJ/RimL family protein N-acetyltransferase